MKEVFEPSINLSGQFFEPLDFNSRHSNFVTEDVPKKATPEEIEKFKKMFSSVKNTFKTLGSNSSINISPINKVVENLEQELFPQQNNLSLQTGAIEPEKKYNKNLIISLSIGGGALILVTVLLLVFRKKKK